MITAGMHSSNFILNKKRSGKNHSNDYIPLMNSSETDLFSKVVDIDLIDINYY
jgi:hypothetical protein